MLSIMIRLGHIIITTVVLTMISFFVADNSGVFDTVDSQEEEFAVSPMMYSIDEPAHEGYDFYYLRFNSTEQAVCNHSFLRSFRSANANEGQKLLRIVRQKVLKSCIKISAHFSFSDIFMHRSASSMYELYIYAFHKIII